MRFLWPLCVFLFIISAISIVPIIAAESLQLIATIPIGNDSILITNFTPIGDFNGDGYNDLLIAVAIDPYHQIPPFDEAAYIFYGGPSFDSIPDLVLEGEFNPTFSGFGTVATGLGDFNGDGYDDIAIAAPYFCGDDINRGRIYFYFGGPGP